MHQNDVITQRLMMKLHWQEHSCFYDEWWSQSIIASMLVAALRCWLRIITRATSRTRGQCLSGALVLISICRSALLILWWPGVISWPHNSFAMGWTVFCWNSPWIFLLRSLFVTAHHQLQRCARLCPDLIIFCPSSIYSILSSVLFCPYSILFMITSKT